MPRVELLNAMENRMVITVADYERLTCLTEFASLRKKMPEIAEQFYSGVMGARMLSPESISGNIITMNTRLLLQDLSNRREAELTITYPQDADSRQQKISVFSSVGTALLGRKVGDVVSWKVPAGMGQFKILKIIYQPEAVGNYTL